jgi:hypothetical protein
MKTSPPENLESIGRQIGRAAATRYDDPFDDPDFDIMAWINTLDFLPESLVIRRHEFIEWAGAAGFVDIEMRDLDEPDFWELRCKRGTNAECTTPCQIERCLGFVARGAGCQFSPGQFIALVIGESIAARFRLEPREKP